MSKLRTWTVREATPDDDVALAGLFRLVFGFDRSSTHYRWKFADNPAGAPVIALAEDRGEVVGQYALWPVQLRLGLTTANGAQSLDTMTHPDYRGQGMFTVLAEECMRYAMARGIEALYGFPNENSYPGFVRKLDWDCTGLVSMWVRPINIGSHKCVPRWIAPAATAISKVLPYGSRPGYELIERMPTSFELEPLLSVTRTRREFCSVERTGAYLSWRFSSDSAMRYRSICATRGGELRAFGVWGTDIRSGNAMLCELLGEDLDALRAVLAACVEQASAAECPLMLSVSSRVGLETILRGAGFFRRAGIPLIVRKLTARTLGANVHEHANWEIFGADLDTF